MVAVRQGLAACGIAKELEDLLALVDTAPMPPTVFYLFGGTGWALITIFVCVVLSQRFSGSVWIRSLVFTGQLALTLYVAHVVIGMGVLDIFGRLENQRATVAVVSALAFCAVGLGFSVIWRSYFKQGPLEYVLRRVVKPLSEKFFL